MTNPENRGQETPQQQMQGSLGEPQTPLANVAPTSGAHDPDHEAALSRLTDDGGPVPERH